MEFDLDSLINRVQSTHDQYLKEKERFVTELALSQEKTDNAVSELNNANTKISQITEELSVIKQELQEKSAELEKATSKKEVDQILNNDAAVYKELHNKYEALKEKYDTETSSLNKTIGELTKNAENFETYSNSLKAEIQENTTAFANLQNKYVDLENQKKDLQTAFAELKEKHNKSIEAAAGFDVKIGDLEKQLQDEVSQISDEKAKYNDLKAKTLGSIKHLVEDVIEPNEAKIKSLQDELSLVTTKVDSKVYQEVIDKNNKLSIRIEELTKDISDKDSRIVDLTQKISELTEQIRELTPVKKAHSSLQDYIDSTIPVPEGTAASEIEKPIRATKSSTTINTPFGIVTSDIINKASQMIDRLYNDTHVKANGEYVLSNALQAAEDVGLSVSTGNTIMERLCAMTKNGKPLVYFNGNIYYATINKEELKSYILKG